MALEFLDQSIVLGALDLTDYDMHRISIVYIAQVVAIMKTRLRSWPKYMVHRSHDHKYFPFCNTCSLELPPFASLSRHFTCLVTLRIMNTCQ